MSNDRLFATIIKCHECGINFSICKACYRGHRYCSRQCFKTSRYLKQKQYRKKYSLSPRGRRNQSLRQNRYRKKMLRSNLPKKIKNSYSIGSAGCVSSPVKRANLKICVICQKSVSHFYQSIYHSRTHYGGK